MVVTCKFCGHTVSLDRAVVRAASHRAVRERALVAFRDAGGLHRIDDFALRLGSPLGHGEATDVFAGERFRTAPERVIVKVLRDDANLDHLAREARVLTALQGSEARGAEHFATRLLAPVHQGVLEGPSFGGRTALVHRARSGFSHDLDAIAEVHGRGIDPRHAVWIWRRTLETLAFVHASGFGHGAVLPQHLVVHLRDHGVLLVGFGVAGRLGEPLVATSTHHARLYPASVGEGTRLSRELDLMMAARSIAYLLAGDAVEDGDALAHVPAALTAILTPYVTGSSKRPTDDANDLHRLVGEAARRAFGPPKFVDLRMPDPTKI